VFASLYEFFRANDVIVQFVHGQVFLLLGVATGLQFFQRSRLDLARALPWLALFGLFEALATWGNTFIPIQQSLLPDEAVSNLRFLQLQVYVLCFASLLGFGLRLNEPVTPTWMAPTAAFVVVLFFGTLIAVNVLIPSATEIINAGAIEALLRYLLCIPSALLVAFGLRQQAYRLIGPLQAPELVNVLRVAGFGFLFYALVEGVIVPRAPFPPASLINAEGVFEATGMPIGVLRSIVGAVIAFFMFRSLEAFRIETNRIADALANQQALNTERERISRDLHDGTLQNIYAAGLMLEDARHALAEQPAAVNHADAQLGNVLTALNKTTTEIRGYIYDLRRTVAGEEDLARGLFDIVTEFRLRTALPTDWDVEGCGQFNSAPEQRYHIYQIVRESLSNISRHASASRAWVKLTYGDCKDDVAQFLQVQIRDNGNGTVSQARIGRGLLNMRERAVLLGAAFDIAGEPGKGTVVSLTIDADRAVR
jgi:signal transduction histidine kinase